MSSETPSPQPEKTDAEEARLAALREENSPAKVLGRYKEGRTDQQAITPEKVQKPVSPKDGLHKGLRTEK